MKAKTYLAALAIAGAVTLTGCGSQEGTHSNAYSNPGTTYASNDACTATPDHANVYPTSNGTGVHIYMFKGPRVFGDVFITCSPAPRNQITRVELWYHKMGATRWDLQNYTQQKIIPGSQQLLYSVSTPCVPGMYQVRWSVVGTDSEGQHFVRSAEWHYAQVISYDCSRSTASPEPTQTGDGPVY